MTSAVEVVGTELLNGSTDTTKFDSNQLKGKYIGLYFSAHWCGPCRNFTPKLAEAYKQANSDTFDIVFVSGDTDQASFDEYYKEMPWKAIPFADRTLAEKLNEKYEIQGIPSLIILKPDGSVLTADGDGELRKKGKDAILKWSKGQSIYWSREANAGEHTWNNVYCDNCDMKPIVGVRYGCAQCSDYDSCQQCKENNSHEHELMKYFIPKTKYSLSELFGGNDVELLDKNDQKIKLDSLKDKYLGLYFSAHWCPPCRHFTPQLAEIYKQSVAANLPFDIIFLSSDEDQESFNEYYKEMPWKAVPFENRMIKQRLSIYYGIQGIPSLVIIKPSGETLTIKGRRDIDRNKLKAIEAWVKGEKVKNEPVKPEDFVWRNVTCDGCRTEPIVGLRYYCKTCGNYDLCAACKEKGHEHELKLIDMPKEDDDED